MRRMAVHRQQLHQGPLLHRRRKRAFAHGIGQTKGGRNTKLHAVCDAKDRPLVLLLKGYDSQALREWLDTRGPEDVIPARENRKIQDEYDKASQTDEMQAKKQQLVVPKRLHSTYRPTPQAGLIGVADLVCVVRSRQAT